MKKYILGTLFGIILTISSSIYADDIKSIIGLKVEGEFPITFQGKQLEKKSIIVNGSSYLPVRAMGEALGLDISFNADLGIELKIKEGVNSMNISEVSSDVINTSPTVTSIIYSDNQGKINILKISIDSYKIMLNGFEDKLKKNHEGEESIFTIKLKENIAKTKEAISIAEKRIEDLQ